MQYRFGYDAIGVVKLPYDQSVDTLNSVERKPKKLNASLAFRLRKYTPLVLNPLGMKDKSTGAHNMRITNKSRTRPNTKHIKSNENSIFDVDPIRVPGIDDQEENLDREKPKRFRKKSINTLADLHIEDFDSDNGFDQSEKSKEISFLTKAAAVLTLSPTKTKKDELERSRMLQSKERIVTKHDDVRKLLGWGPSLSNQREYIIRSQLADVCDSCQQNTSSKPKIRRWKGPKKAPEPGVVVITNRHTSKFELPPLKL